MSEHVQYETVHSGSDVHILNLSIIAMSSLINRNETFSLKWNSLSYTYSKKVMVFWLLLKEKIFGLLLIQNLKMLWGDEAEAIILDKN